MLNLKSFINQNYNKKYKIGYRREYNLLFQQKAEVRKIVILKFKLRDSSDPSFSRPDVYKSGLVNKAILMGNPSPLFLAVDKNSCDILDILLLMVECCPKDFLKPPQPTSDGHSVLNVAASKGYKTALEKLIRSDIFTPKEIVRACLDFKNFALLREYLASPLFFLTQRFPIFQETCVESNIVKKGYVFSLSF